MENRKGENREQGVERATRSLVRKARGLGEAERTPNYRFTMDPNSSEDKAKYDQLKKDNKGKKSLSKMPRGGKSNYKTSNTQTVASAKKIDVYVRPKRRGKQSITDYVRDRYNWPGQEKGK